MAMIRPVDEAAQHYFRSVEEHFVRLRGQPLLLSPEDVQRVARWHAQGIPLAAVIEGMGIHFDRITRRGKAPRRAVTLAYLEDDVIDAWAGGRRRRLGRGSAKGGEAAPEPLVSTGEHARLLAALDEAAARLGGGDATAVALASDVAAARAKLEKKSELFDPSHEGHDEQRTEDHLRRIERSLGEAARRALGERLAAIEAEIASELEAKRTLMSASTFERISAQLLDKRLRERFGLPRLSLFYA
jgi:hypothetical protein